MTVISWWKSFARLLPAALCLVLVPTCGESEESATRITTKVVRGSFRHTLEVEGVIEAERNYALTVPRIGPPWPEISFLVPEGTSVNEGDIVVAFSPEEYHKDLDAATRSLEVARSELEQSEADQNMQIAQLESQIKSSEKEAESARLQLARLDFEAPREQEIKKLQIARAEIEEEKSRRKLEAIGQVHKEDRAKKGLEIGQLESQVRRAQDNLDALVLRSPGNGPVIYERNRRTGEYVKEGDLLFPNQPVARIPDRTSMIVELNVSETEVQKLRVGQPAVITIPSLDDFRMSGRVASVARMARSVRRNSRVKRVQAIVAVDSAGFAPAPGLTTNCSVLLEEVPEALIIPLDCVFERDSLQVVYVHHQGSFEPRPVELGRKNADFAVVKSGLNGDEELALKEPPRSRIKAVRIAALNG